MAKRQRKSAVVSEAERASLESEALYQAQTNPEAFSSEHIGVARRLFIDGGNAYVKWLIGSQEGSFVHAIAELTNAEWDYAMSHYNDHAVFDLIQIGRKKYAIGETAENFLVSKRSGRPKYERDYYGVLFASTIARAFYQRKSVLETGIEVFASHTTDDTPFRKLLRDSIAGEWSFKCAGEEFNFEVKRVLTFEEAFGGYCRVAMQRGDNGGLALEGYTTAVFDVGGGTCGVVLVNGDGQIQPGVGKTGGFGILSAIERLKNELYRSNMDLFRRAANPPEERFRYAIANRVYKGFGREIPCSAEVDRALSPLMNELNTLWVTRLNAGAGVDKIVFTGGGSAILENYLRQMVGFNSEDVMLADEQAIQFANVRGAGDFITYLDELGLLESLMEERLRDRRKKTT